MPGITVTVGRMGTRTAAQEAPATRRRPLLLPLAAGVVGLLVVAGAALAGPWYAVPRRVRPPAAPEAFTPAPAEELPTTEPPVVPDDGSSAFTAVLVIVVVVLLALLLRTFARRVTLARGTSGANHESVPGTVTSVVDAEIEPDLPALRRGVTAARSVLSSAAEPDDAIVAAWLELEAAAASSGVQRAPSDTPTELTTAVLDATRADPAATRTLLGLYHRARFAPGAVMGPAEVAEAGRCLERLAESWEER